MAVTIGLFGIAAGISAQVLARRGEFGALRHLGFTRGQVATMLAIEGSVLGALGVIVGLVAGTVISLILIYVVNRQSFHWSMDLSAPVGLFVGAERCVGRRGVAHRSRQRSSGDGRRGGARGQEDW